MQNTFEIRGFLGNTTHMSLIQRFVKSFESNEAGVPVFNLLAEKQLKLKS